MCGSTMSLWCCCYTDFIQDNNESISNPIIPDCVFVLIPLTLLDLIGLYLRNRIGMLRLQNRCQKI